MDGAFIRLSGSAGPGLLGRGWNCRAGGAGVGGETMSDEDVKAEVEYWLSGRVYYTTTRGDPIARALAHVAEQIWSEHCEALEGIRAIFIADAAYPAKIYCPTWEAGKTLKVLILPCDADESDLPGLIAHELAHIVLGHDAGGPEREKEATALAEGWGFKVPDYSPWRLPD